MMTRLWTVGIKVPDLDRELEFQKALGNSVVLDETINFEGHRYRIPLMRVGDKYVHLAEQMVYENLLPAPLSTGIAHVVYVSDAIEQDFATAVAYGAQALMEVTTVSAGFGRRRVAFLRAPSGYVFELIEILENLVPAV